MLACQAFHLAAYYLAHGTFQYDTHTTSPYPGRGRPAHRPTPRHIIPHNGTWDYLRAAPAPPHRGQDTMHGTGHVPHGMVLRSSAVLALISSMESRSKELCSHSSASSAASFIASLASSLSARSKMASWG